MFVEASVQKKIGGTVLFIFQLQQRKQVFVA